MNLLEVICEELGVKIGEEWSARWETDNQYANYTKFKITETGLMGYREDYDSWWTGDRFLPDLIYGRLKPVWKPEWGEGYYYPRVDITTGWDAFHWAESTNDNHRLNNNLVFKTKEEAIACAEKMLQAIKEE